MFDRLLNATIDTMSKHLASSLRKGGILHHPFYQPVMKFGQRYSPTPVNEEKAMQAGAEVLVCYTLAGFSSGVMVYSVKKYFDLEKHNRLELEQLKQKSRQEIEEAMKQLRQSKWSSGQDNG